MSIQDDDIRGLIEQIENYKGSTQICGVKSDTTTLHKNL